MKSIILLFICAASVITLQAQSNDFFASTSSPYLDLRQKMLTSTGQGSHTVNLTDDGKDQQWKVIVEAIIIPWLEKETNFRISIKDYTYNGEMSLASRTLATAIRALKTGTDFDSQIEKYASLLEGKVRLDNLTSTELFTMTPLLKGDVELGYYSSMDDIGIAAISSFHQVSDILYFLTSLKDGNYRGNIGIYGKFNPADVFGWEVNLEDFLGMDINFTPLTKFELMTGYNGHWKNLLVKSPTTFGERISLLWADAETQTRIVLEDVVKDKNPWNFTMNAAIGGNFSFDIKKLAQVEVFLMGGYGLTAETWGGNKGVNFDVGFVFVPGEKFKSAAPKID